MLLQYHQKQQQADVAQCAAGNANSDQKQPPPPPQEGTAVQQLSEQLADASLTNGSSTSVPAEEAAVAEAAAADAEQETEQRQQQEPSQQDGQHKDQAQKQQQQQQPGTKPGNQHLQQQQQQQQQQQGRQQHAGSSTQLQAALRCLDEDVAANVCLGLAKLNLYTLTASHELHVEGKQLSYSYASPSDVPGVLSFDALPGMPELADLAWGDAALAASPDAALALLKAALPWFKEALQYYKLEGWVTEHCNILFEMSNLYRCLAGFEADPHKRCVLHRSRAKLLQPLEGQLSQQHYPGLARSISLELGNVFREIGDIKTAAGREPDKVAAAAVAASRHYQLFLDSFRGDDGQLPLKVEAEMEQHYLSAAFCMARVLQAGAVQRKEPSAYIATLEQAVYWLDTLVAYVQHNSVTAWGQEASMAAEMAALLKEKLELTSRQLAMQQRLRAAA
ncbi:KIF-1 binding protein [Scenedesmus sp. NREL 46B-D3]|nr:KIF-1 binding protein [Scenedesmus sp. NREL 46B-D3]